MKEQSYITIVCLVMNLVISASYCWFVYNFTDS